MKKITIVDCGIVNRASIRNMLKVLGFESSLSNSPEQISSSDILILPGIGAYDAFMNTLLENKLLDVLKNAVLKKKIPVLGICLGMQILFERSEEGKLPGLGWIEGEVLSLKTLFNENIKPPHIGWKNVSSKDTFLPSSNQYYFVHNYYCIPKNIEHTVGEISLGGRSIAVFVKKDNIYGVQFHPEKSHRHGLEFFNSFIKHVS